MEQFDVVIVGGGPGGSTLASCLAQRGRSALVLERARFPRFHIGESLLPRSCEIFRSLGLLERIDELFLRKHGARFLCASTGRTVRYDFAEAFESGYPFAYQVERAAFDDLLLRRAAELGADVREEWEAVDVLFEDGRAAVVRARCLAEPERIVEFRPRMVVDATGRDTLLAGRMRHKAKIATLDKTALFSHYRGIPREAGIEEGDIRILVFEHGWFWVIPFRGDVTSMGAVVSAEWMRQRAHGEPLDTFFQRTLDTAPVARELTAGAERLRPVGALADFSYRVDQLTGDGWLFVGDSAGFLDPLFSTGAHLAIKGGALAAEAIDDALVRGDVSRASFAGYETAIRYAADLFLGVVQGFYRGPVRETLFDQRQRPVLRRIITSILSGDVFHLADRPTWATFVASRYPAELPRFG